MTPMQPAQHSSPFFTNCTNHWEPVKNAAYHPTPQPHFQSTKPHNMITYNFTQGPYDLLDDKICLFLSVCVSISVTPNPFAPLIWLILNGKALQLLTNISRKESFRGMYDKLKRHFLTEKNHHQYYTD
ncbi:hypothetical protein Golomagni_02879 [Golovinomyces magnicellulatus]|nr:hypothetical protein Golomagni_02879 [Golovinomyces magnicellulatus]